LFVSLPPESFNPIETPLNWLNDFLSNQTTTAVGLEEIEVKKIRPPNANKSYHVTSER
jgi:hypothetical protein